jgi:hypothetical protein
VSPRHPRLQGSIYQESCHGQGVNAAIVTERLGALVTESRTLARNVYLQKIGTVRKTREGVWIGFVA